MSIEEKNNVYCGNCNHYKSVDDIDKMTKKNMLHKKSWVTFRNSGLLWWINRTLHLFGWAIVYEFDEKGKVTNVYPARCKFRGFSEDVEEKNFKKLSKYLKQNIDKLLKEVIE